MARLSFVRTAAAVAVSLASIAAGTTPGLAQLAVPAEQPPADFDAAEYVDSAGCVFARVDIGGRIEWVPRVGQDRQQLCGMEPTLAMDTPAPMVQPMPEPVIEAAMPAPAPAPVYPPRTAVRTHAYTPPQVVHAPPVQLIPVQVLVPDTVDTGHVRLRAPCPDPASIAAQYLENSIVPGCTTAPAPSPNLVYGTDHPRPRGNNSPVARLRVERPGPPPGYRNVWTDGRLNPYRGIRTVEGEAQMRMVWTDTVPRRLVPAN
jgi:hypothetical protein